MGNYITFDSKTLTNASRALTAKAYDAAGNAQTAAAASCVVTIRSRPKSCSKPASSPARHRGHGEAVRLLRQASVKDLLATHLMRSRIDQSPNASLTGVCRVPISLSFLRCERVERSGGYASITTASCLDMEMFAIPLLPSLGYTVALKLNELFP